MTVLQQALDLLCGLHPQVTRDEPMEVAVQIFDQVQAERAAHAAALANAQRNIDGRDQMIAKLRLQLLAARRSA